MGVVGCGLMGSGIAQVSARSGYSVVVSEASDELLKKGLDLIAASLDRQVKRNTITAAEKEATLGRIKGTTSLKDFRDCRLVIEAIVERLDLKKKVFSELDGICPPDAILASNTSVISVLDMAMATRRPDRVLGMHFMNPVPTMKLLELVRTIATSQETLKTAHAFGESVGKTVITAPDTPGFIVNRLLLPYLLDAMRAYEAGLASREDIDTGIALGLNHPMGPLTLADFVGLDTLYYMALAMYEEYRNEKYAPPVLLRKMVTAGRMGRKSGKGFYDY